MTGLGKIFYTIFLDRLRYNNIDSLDSSLTTSNKVVKQLEFINQN